MKTSFALANNQFSITCTPSKPKYLPLVLAALHGWLVRAMAGFIPLLLIGNVHAQPLSVDISSSQYLTYVEVLQVTNDSSDIGNVVSRTTTSPVPISDEIDLPILVGQGKGSITHAIANAGLFGVSDQTGWGFANAEAVSQLWFSPLADHTQTLNVQINASSGFSPDFTAGQIRLSDLTANSEVWNYSWNAGGSGMVPVPVPSGNNIPWETLSPTTANFDLDTDFLASDEYELTMIVCSNAGDDSESAQIQVTGVEAVPEPSSVCLVLPALLGLTAARRSARR
jgi:hypothetical protein